MKPEAGVGLAGASASASAADTVWHKELLHPGVIAQKMHTLLDLAALYLDVHGA